MLQKLTKPDYLVSSWSGGTTTQLAIFPPDANYADRDFLWRVSSATVDLEESDFTPLPDYERLISTLEGEIELTHNGGEARKLRPLEVHAFSGADATHSRGRCRDFNLMLRRGRVTGSMEPLFLTETPLCVAAHIVRHPGSETLLLYCASGQCTVGAAKTSPAYREGGPASRPVEGCRQPEAESSRNCHSERSARVVEESITLAPGEALLLSDPSDLRLTGPAVLMLCRMSISDPTPEQFRSSGVYANAADFRPQIIHTR